MNRNCLLLIPALALAVALPATGDEQLNVRTGTWEIESATQMRGTMPLSKQLRDTLTPAQIAKMQAELKAEAAKGPTREVSRECVTQDDLERPFQSAHRDECKQTFVKTSRTSQEVRLECSGEHKGSGVLKLSTPTPQIMNGNLELRYGEGADPWIISMTMKGRWLSAECEEEDEDYDYESDEDEEPADDPEEE